MLFHCFVDLTAISNGKQMNDIFLNIKCIDDPIGAHAQSVAVLPLQPVVRKRGESKSHLIDLVFDSGLDLGRQFKKGRIEAGLVNLERSRHPRTRQP